MISRFADTFFYLAILNRDDTAHVKAVQLSRQLAGQVVTTAWVLTEVADAMSAPGSRSGFIDLLRALRSDPRVHIVGPDDSSFEAGLRLYAERPDKNRSLTDCISFGVMHEYAISEALTGDHHFKQAGFIALL